MGQNSESIPQKRRVAPYPFYGIQPEPACRLFGWVCEMLAFRHLDWSWLSFCDLEPLADP